MRHLCNLISCRVAIEKLPGPTTLNNQGAQTASHFKPSLDRIFSSQEKQPIRSATAIKWTSKPASKVEVVEQKGHQAPQVDALVRNFQLKGGVKLTFEDGNRLVASPDESRPKGSLNLTKREFDLQRRTQASRPLVVASNPKLPDLLRDPKPSRPEPKPRLQRKPNDQAVDEGVVKEHVPKVLGSKMQVNQPDLLREMLGKDAWSYGPETEIEKLAKQELYRDDIYLKPSKTRLMSAHKTPTATENSWPHQPVAEALVSQLSQPLDPALCTAPSFYRHLRHNKDPKALNFRVKNPRQRSKLYK